MSGQPYLSQTAPIDEYRVLWTTQKKQKLKKWHDGFLRFHKFNKRMLVYDDARHLVADMYLRGRDAIGEGDDLEFEHHLVTVEDFKETVVQDLTPLFSPALQRKQQIQAGNALLNSPTPNLANRHGPWGPNRHAMPTPQSVQQRQSMATARSPQTPVQRRPTGVLGLTSQQTVRQGLNHPIPPQDRLSRSVQRPPPVVPASPALTIDPSPQRPNPVLRSNPPQRPNLSHNPTQTPRQPRQNPVPANQFPRRLPCHAPGGPVSPSIRANPPPPAPLQRTQLSSPKSHHAALPTPPRARPRPPVTFFDPTSNPDLIRPSPAPSRRPTPPTRLESAVSRSVEPRKNKRTPDVAFDQDSDFDLFGPSPDFQIFASSSEPTPISRQNNVSSDPVLSCAKKWSLGEARPFDSPTKQDSSSSPIVHEPRVPETIAASMSKSDGLISESGEDSEEKPTSGSLINAGILHLNNATTRKRNKLLCQRPPNYPTAALQAQSAWATAPPPKKNTSTMFRTGSSSKTPLPVVAEGVMVVDDSSSGDKSDIRSVDRRKPSDTFRGSAGVRKLAESRRNSGGKGK